MSGDDHFLRPDNNPPCMYPDCLIKTELGAHACEHSCPHITEMRHLRIIQRLRKRLADIHEISQDNAVPDWQKLQNIAATAQQALDFD